ncbi:hypothetical protein FB559_4422 [Actinoallomurus bryophytorum]|uniref:Uncharacterized protein n=1 Tax=Actinoallomurus bryophytorum TaxID=1490222 RepID=A0A543CNV1_9ACTN|nr:hypothetical protein FB559_4422 [Actinoallomurus bryophytorum]
MTLPTSGVGAVRDFVRYPARWDGVAAPVVCFRGTAAALCAGVARVGVLGWGAPRWAAAVAVNVRTGRPGRAGPYAPEPRRPPVWSSRGRPTARSFSTGVSGERGPVRRLGWCARLGGTRAGGAGPPRWRAGWRGWVAGLGGGLGGGAGWRGWVGGAGWRGWVAGLGGGAGWRGWVAGLGGGAGWGLGGGAGWRGWVAGLGGGAGWRGWVAGLGGGAGWRGWVAGLGGGAGWRGWVAGLGGGAGDAIPRPRGRVGS